MASNRAFDQVGAEYIDYEEKWIDWFYAIQFDGARAVYKICIASDLRGVLVQPVESCFVYGVGFGLVDGRRFAQISSNHSRAICPGDAFVVRVFAVGAIMGRDSGEWTHKMD